MTALNVLVLSDLHCTSEPPGDHAGSWLTTTTVRNPRNHPLMAVDKVLKDSGIVVDLILCAGDLCQKADVAALQYVWRELTSLAQRLNARLVATVGNHDMDSRHATGADPKGALFDLDPIFPCLDETLRDHYWSREYAIVQSQDWRVVTLNSCALHGYAPDGVPELELGSVSTRTCDRLAGELDRLGPISGPQLLLTHHHLETLPHVDKDDRSQMKDAQDLIEVLTLTGPWLVVHGHKHRARLLYAHGSGGSPIIFSAGSFSAFPSGGLTAEEGRNQFYVLMFPERAELDSSRIGLGGFFRAWDWTVSGGWVPAVLRSGLPAHGGFGWRADPSLLARELEVEVRRSGTLNVEQLAALEPRFSYIIPSDLDYVARMLAARSIAVERNEAGQFISVGQQMGGSAEEET